MLNALRTFFFRWFATPASEAPTLPAAMEQAPAQLVPYDENLLERSRTQWQFGDWESLAKLDFETLQYHPDRAKLAMLAAAGRLQMDQYPEAKYFIRLAKNWGAHKKLISQILIAGVHNSIGRAATIGNLHNRARQHFEKSIILGAQGADVKLIAQARLEYQFKQLKIEALVNKQLRFLHFKAEHKLVDPFPLYPNSSEREQYFNQNGEALYEAGNYKLAAEFFQRAFELAPDNAWYCQNLAEAIARLEFQVGDQWECDQLSKNIQKNGKWDVAVRHYRRALKIDSAKVEEHHKKQLFQLEPKQGGQVENPIFIVGCGHSGTSLMLAILGNHLRINPIPKETALFLQPDSIVQKMMSEFDSKCMAQEKFRWVEKTPPHIFQIHRFLAFRPKSQFVLMMRDGRDVVCSLKSRIGYASFEDRLDRWLYDNKAAQPYWQHPQVKIIKYEDLITDTECTLRNLCKFLGEEYSSQMVDYHKTEHRWYSSTIAKPDSINTHQDHMDYRNWQINQPIFDGRGRWRGEMTEVEKQTFKESFGQHLLEYFSYTSNSKW